MLYFYFVGFKCSFNFGRICCFNKILNIKKNNNDGDYYVFQFALIRVKFKRKYKITGDTEDVYPRQCTPWINDGTKWSLMENMYRFKTTVAVWF